MEDVRALLLYLLVMEVGGEEDDPEGPGRPAERPSVMFDTADFGFGFRVEAEVERDF